MLLSTSHGGMSALLLINTAHGIRRRGSAHLLQLIVISEIGLAGTVDVLLVLNDLRVDSLEFGLEDGAAGGRRKAIGAAARVGKVVVVVLELGTSLAPALLEVSLGCLPRVVGRAAEERIAG